MLCGEHIDAVLIEFSGVLWNGAWRSRQRLKATLVPRKNVGQVFCPLDDGVIASE